MAAGWPPSIGCSQPSPQHTCLRSCMGCMGRYHYWTVEQHDPSHNRDDLTCRLQRFWQIISGCCMSDGSESADSFPSSCNQKHLFTRLLILETNDTKDCPRFEKVLDMSSHYWRVLPADSLRWTAIHHLSRGFLWLQEYIFSKKHSNPANDYLKANHHRRIRVDIWSDINIAQLI